MAAPNTFADKSGQIQLSLLDGNFSYVDTELTALQTNIDALDLNNITGNVDINGSLSLGGDLTITGDLTVSGTTVTVNATNLAIEDNMIYLNSENTTQNLDLGIAGNYNDGTYAHTGLFRDASDGYWKFYDNYTPEPDASPYIDTAHVSFNIAPIQASTVKLNNWTITESSGVLYFATGGTNKMKLDANGNLTVTGDVTAFGTI